MMQYMWFASYKAAVMQAMVILRLRATRTFGSSMSPGPVKPSEIAEIAWHSALPILESQRSCFLACIYHVGLRFTSSHPMCHCTVPASSCCGLAVVRVECDDDQIDNGSSKDG